MSSNLTSGDVFRIVWNKIRESELFAEVPVMYADHYPTQKAGSSMSGEFIVVNPLTNVVGGLQIATINVNIYVPDSTPTIGGIENRYPNRNRLTELSQLAFDALEGYPSQERYFFDVSDESLISEEEIPYSFANIKVKLTKY